MKKAIILGILLAFSAGAHAAQAAPTQWAADPNHSSAGFTVVHLALSKVTGIIPIKSATIQTGASPELPTSVEATLDPAGIDTRNQKRDDDLRSSDFFDVGKYPTIAFKSTSIAAGSGGDFTIAGNLTMHGVTKPVTLKAHFNGTGPGAKNEQRASYSATTTVDRRDYGMNWGNTTPGGALVVAYSITIDLEIEAVGS